MKSLPQSCEQCLEEFSTALDDLRTYANRSSKGLMTESQARELITNFEVAHEIALKLITKYFQRLGKGPFSEPRNMAMEAFYADLIDDGKAWLDMSLNRIQYNPVHSINTQEKFLENIKKDYINLFEKFEDTMEKKLNE